MSVESGEAAPMINDDAVSIAAPARGVDYDSAGRRLDSGAAGGVNVYTSVHPADLENRVDAISESGDYVSLDGALELAAPRSGKSCAALPRVPESAQHGSDFAGVLFEFRKGPLADGLVAEKAALFAVLGVPLGGGSALLEFHLLLERGQLPLAVGDFGLAGLCLRDRALVAGQDLAVATDNLVEQIEAVGEVIEAGGGEQDFEGAGLSMLVDDDQALGDELAMVGETEIGGLVGQHRALELYPSTLGFPVHSAETGLCAVEARVNPGKLPGDLAPAPPDTVQLSLEAAPLALDAAQALEQRLGIRGVGAIGGNGHSGNFQGEGETDKHTQAKSPAMEEGVPRHPRLAESHSSPHADNYCQRSTYLPRRCPMAAHNPLEYTTSGPRVQLVGEAMVERSR